MKSMFPTQNQVVGFVQPKHAMEIVDDLYLVDPFFIMPAFSDIRLKKKYIDKQIVFSFTVDYLGDRANRKPNMGLIDSSLQEYSAMLENRQGFTKWPILSDVNGQVNPKNVFQE